MGASQKSGMDRSAVIRTMDRECLRKVPHPYPFVRAHHSIQTVLILPDLLLLLLLLLFPEDPILKNFNPCIEKKSFSIILKMAHVGTSKINTMINPILILRLIKID